VRAFGLKRVSTAQDEGGNALPELLRNSIGSLAGADCARFKTRVIVPQE
jgi:hypothetical protein